MTKYKKCSIKYDWRYYMKFGVYAGSAVGLGDGLLKGKFDEADKINNALNELQGSAKDFLVRAYIHYKGNGQSANHTPINPKQYAINNRRLDLVLCYQTNENNIIKWNNFIKEIINEYKDTLATLQITEETNVKGHSQDGDYEYSKKALIEGVVEAKKIILKNNLKCNVGFNVSPSFAPNDPYWDELKKIAMEDFYKSLDYVGFDFFPDVFFPIELEKIDGAVEFLLTSFRGQVLEKFGISKNIPIHVTENGWPTSSTRTYEKQALVLEKTIRKIYDLQKRLNIAYYELFNLRDANTSIDNIGNQFGIMTDEYKPKPAFEKYKELIKEYYEE
ncbi:MAG: hypothetical protein LBG80_11730 [Bacteroidales bacterium]|nr:hypothetical protein [Bacteroidales bacterium]